VIEFKTLAQKECYERVGVWLEEVYASRCFRRASSPVFEVRPGRLVVVVSIRTWGAGEAVVKVTSWAITGATMTAELGSHLLTRNDEVRFGAYGIDGDGDIFFSYSINGATCDKPEVVAAVSAVAFSAEESLGEVIPRFGGKAFGG
jgi:hypothetical protein